MLGLPGLLALLVFHYVPLLGNVIAFQDYQPFLGISGSPWVGLQNFAIIVNGDPEFLNALGNTLILTLHPGRSSSSRCRSCWRCCSNSLISERWKRSRPVDPLPAALPVLGDRGRPLPADARQRRDAQHLPVASRTFRPCNIIGVPELFKVLHHRPGDLEGHRLVARSSSWPRCPGSTPTSTRRPRSTAPAAWRRMWHITLPAMQGLIILLLILRLGDS